MLGFIQYIFLPTAFFTLLNNKFDELVIPLAPSYEFLNEIKNFTTVKDETTMSILKKYIETIDELWTLDDKDCLKILKNFCNDFNKQWQENDGNLLQLNVFENTFEIGEYVIPKNHDAIFLEVLEEDMGLTKKQWENVYMNVYENKFIKNKFIDILNYKIGCFS